MGDPLSVAASGLAIATATVQTTKFLYQTVQSFTSHQSTVEQLARELADLSKVLVSLCDHIKDDEQPFLPLKSPLLQCRQACANYAKFLEKCNKHSKNGRTSLRDVGRLNFMSSDMANFTSMLASYRSTINITMADANLRHTKVTLQVLNEYKDMIHDTKHDLEKHLGDISTKLQSLSTQHREKVLGTVSQVEQIEVERDSTERCLEMCSQVLTLINNMRFHPTAKQPHQDETVPVTLSPQDLTLAETTTLSSLRVCSAKLSDTISELRSHQDATRDSLARSGPQPRDPEMNLDLEVDMHMLRGELDSTERRLAICEHASARATPAQVHVIEDIRAGNDSIQICASTLGDLFNVKRAITGNGGFQFFGSTTPKSLEQILAIENQRHFHRNKEQVTVEGDITSETGAGAGAGGSRAI